MTGGYKGGLIGLARNGRNGDIGEAERVMA
jgi:hypothetical protein